MSLLLCDVPEPPGRGEGEGFGEGVARLRELHRRLPITVGQLALSRSYLIVPKGRLGLRQ